MTDRWTRRSAVVATLGGLTLPARAQSEPYPSRPLKIIVPTPPGGGADAFARVIGARLGEQMKATVIIENRPGAAGNAAAEQVKRMAPDGYTLFIGAIAILAISPSLYKNLPFDPLKDFSPITMGVVLSNLLVAHPSLPAHNVRELIALAKARPGVINYSSSGNATAGHLAGELFAALTDTQLVHVPYKGGGPAMVDLIAGHVQISFASPPSALPHVKSGKLRALAVSTAKRTASAPDVPTVAESGYPGFEYSNWNALFAPAGTPQPHIRKINAQVVAALKDPVIAQRLTSQGADPAPGTPEELGKYMRSDHERWKKVISSAGIKPQ